MQGAMLTNCWQLSQPSNSPSASAMRGGRWRILGAASSRWRRPGAWTRPVDAGATLGATLGATPGALGMVLDDHGVARGAGVETARGARRRIRGQTRGENMCKPHHAQPKACMYSVIPLDTRAQGHLLNETGTRSCPEGHTGEHAAARAYSLRPPPCEANRANRGDKACHGRVRMRPAHGQ